MDQISPTTQTVNFKDQQITALKTQCKKKDDKIENLEIRQELLTIEAKKLRQRNKDRIRREVVAMCGFENGKFNEDCILEFLGCPVRLFEINEDKVEHARKLLTDKIYKSEENGETITEINSKLEKFQRQWLKKETIGTTVEIDD